MKQEKGEKLIISYCEKLINLIGSLILSQTLPGEKMILSSLSKSFDELKDRLKLFPTELFCMPPYLGLFCSEGIPAILVSPADDGFSHVGKEFWLGLWFALAAADDVMSSTMSSRQNMRSSRIAYSSPGNNCLKQTLQEKHSTW